MVQCEHPDCDDTFETLNAARTHYGHVHDPIEYECEVCGSTYEAKPYEDRVVCSRVCAADRGREILDAEPEINWYITPRDRPRILHGETGFHVHQLIAIANGADPHKVFGNRQYNIHHKNGFKFDNRPSNIEMLTASEHGKIDGKKAKNRNLDPVLEYINVLTDETSVELKKAIEIFENAILD